jgi:hypothetical protein
VKVEFSVLAKPIIPKEHLERLRMVMPQKHKPLTESGTGKEFYLTTLPDAFAARLIEIIGDGYDSSLFRSMSGVDLQEVESDEAEKALMGRTDIGSTTKEQLVKARRGQGLFKTNVRLNEKRCRVTGTTTPKHLIASHIKPWCKSNDEEKLSGCNGLLLAPHIDHLFDKGLISFSDDGQMLVSGSLDSEILKLWNIQMSIPAKRFTPEQGKFLRYHREKWKFDSPKVG